MQIKKATSRDVQHLVQLMHRLWPDAPMTELSAEVRLGLRSDKMHYFLAVADEPIGFCQLSFRYDYVPGATGEPTAFIEGIYVVDSERGNAVATNLVETATRFARSNGCTELASDTELENTGSQQFHERIGFKEVERTVHYIKKISRYE
ncbi:MULTISPECIES: aminoglycoside 6'-N-acetyltransferase [Exiguobacterium]|uniref:aminoglycoside 6'-N-acetyltransferase n=1 Tax=Exiguobacterium TaxID=33986 RepID=UPI001BE91CDC|nr:MULTISPECIES: aminoglycoside 6'-N-acetyltransferase [Exiguobacterium]MCT4781858.1 GNAT family N-acetyltransferase [Exiguobacterium himgiriensis]